MVILYIGYAPQKTHAPHQSMIVEYLSRNGIEVEYLCWSAGYDHIFSNSGHVRFLHFSKQGSKLLSFMRFAFGALRAPFLKHYDFIYVQGAQQASLGLMLSLCFPKIPLIYHTQDYLQGISRFYETTEKLLARRAALVVSNEINRATFMRWSYKLKKTPMVIRTGLPANYPPPVRCPEVRQRFICRAGLTHADDAVIIHAGGFFCDERMSPNLVEAFCLLPDNYILIFTDMASGSKARKKFDIFTAGMPEKIKSRIVLCEERLVFSDLLANYAVSDIGVLLYRNDGVGNFYQAPGRLSEYLISGLSIVCSNYPGLELLDCRYGLGATCDPYSPVEIAQALQQCAVAVRQDRVAQAEKMQKLCTGELAYEQNASAMLHFINHYGKTHE